MHLADASANSSSNSLKRRRSSTRSKPMTLWGSRTTGTDAFRIGAGTASGSNSPLRILRPSEEESSCENPVGGGPASPDFSPHPCGRKQRQMTNVGRGDHCFVTGTNERSGLRREDHVGVQ